MAPSENLNFALLLPLLMIENLKFAHDLKFEILEMNLSHELGVAFTSFCNQRNILITWDFK